MDFPIARAGLVLVDTLVDERFCGSIEKPVTLKDVGCPIQVHKALAPAREVRVIYQGKPAFLFAVETPGVITIRHVIKRLSSLERVYLV